MYEKLFEAQREYREAFSLENRIEHKRLKSIHWTKLSVDDMSILRNASKYLKRIKRAKRFIRNTLDWEERMKNAPKRIKILESKIDEAKKIFCMDLEFCEDSRVLTEVGISIFEDNQQHTHHFIVAETIDCRNSKFVPDNKDNFIFGDSEILSLENIKQKVNELVKGIDLIFGHAFSNDKDFLGEVGCSKLPAIIDSQKLAKLVFKENNQMRLSTILDKLEMNYNYLHNGGNDAHYTMLSILKMVKKD